MAPPRFIRPQSGAALRGLALTIPLLLAPVRPAAADVPFTVRTWTLEHGLPSSSVQDIAQTPDGYLWVTTTGGIARFDGVRFEVFGLQHGLPSNRLQGLVVTSDGTLYASCEDGSVVRWDGHRFTAVPSGSTTPAHTLVALPDGSVVGCSIVDMWILRNGVSRSIPSPSVWHGVPVVDARGRIWIVIGMMPCRLDGDRIATLGPRGSILDRWIPDYRDGLVMFHRPREPTRNCWTTGCGRACGCAAPAATGRTSWTGKDGYGAFAGRTCCCATFAMDTWSPAWRWGSPMTCCGSSWIATGACG